MNNQYSNLPQEIRDNCLFCLWKYEERAGQAKPTKVPYQINGKRAQSNNERTFAGYSAALNAVSRFDGLGLGIFRGFSAIDIDHCIYDDGTLSETAKTIAALFKDCYIEKSPSGKGLRVLFKADGFKYNVQKYYINNSTVGVEVYVFGATKKFVTVTGNVYQHGSVPEASEQLQILLDTFMVRPPHSVAKPQSGNSSYLSDTDVLEKAKTAKNGDAFVKLWSGEIQEGKSHSEMDMALCSHLAFWCGRDTGQMDRLFRQSGLMREKWDRPQSGSTYGQLTLKRAAESAAEIYSPAGKLSQADMDFEVIGSVSLESLTPNNNPRYGWNDIGNGNLFSDCFKDIARYSPERKIWFIYNGTVWQPDVGSLKTMELCKRLADALMRYALELKDGQKRSDYIKFVSKWQVRHNREVIIKDAAGVYPVMMSEFDKNPYLLNCLNGTLNIDTREFHEHRGADMLTKMSGVIYVQDAGCPRWETYIEEVMSGDSDKAVFLQKALGLALTGDTRYECLFILYGPTSRNGKGCMMETFLKLMGDYGLTARPETLGTKQYNNSGNPTEDVARLVGSRFVNISEPDKRLALNAALVKSLVGNDTINARYLHENSFDFKPMFKLFINCNHLPTVNDLTLFTSDRVKIIPFLRHFEEHERDTGLKERFALPENLSGILNWCLDGYQLLEETGLATPASVRDATAEYEKNSDKISLFIEDCMMAEKDSEARTAAVYEEYKGWCYENGYKPESARNFNASMSRLITIEKRRPRGGGSPTTMVTGYRLLYGSEKVSPL